MSRLSASGRWMCATVITSYSIHYTKLYDGKWKQTRGTKEIKGEKYISEFGWDDYCCFDVTTEGQRFINPVITSYSIHYTKLYENNVYNNPEYKTIITHLKEELKKQREELNETDVAYPKLQAIIDANWDK